MGTHREINASVRQYVTVVTGKHNFDRGPQILGAMLSRQLNCLVAPNICGLLVWNLFYITCLASRILRWVLNLWNICAHVTCEISCTRKLSYNIMKGTECFVSL